MIYVRGFFALFFFVLASALQAQDTCVFVVPNTVTLSTTAQATCNCRVTKVELNVYSRQGVHVLASKELKGFPQDVMLAEGLTDGTYLWTIEATVIAVGEPHQLSQKGYLTVLK
jgi:hypothetical protein